MSVFALICLAFLAGCFCGIKFATINILFLILAVAFVFMVKVTVFKTKTYMNLFVSGIIVIFTCGVGLGVYTDYKTFKSVQGLNGSEITVKGIVTETEENNFVINSDYGGIKIYNYTDKVAKKGDCRVYGM